MHEAAVLQHAQNLRLRLQAHGRDFVEEQRAFVRDFEQALLRSDRAGERSLHVAEERGLEQVGRHRPGIDRNERFVAPRRVQVNGFGDDFLAGAALALQQHGRAAVGDLRHQVENLQHGLALAHDVFKVVALLERALELDVFFFGPPPTHRRAHIGEKFFVVPGLLDEIGRARLHGAHRIFHRAVGGDHDDRQARVVGANLRQNVHAVAAGKRQIEQHEIKGTLADLRQALFAAVRRLNFEAFHFEQRLQRFANLGLIVDDEHRSRRRRSAVQRAARNNCRFRHVQPSCSTESRGRRSSPIRDGSRRESCPRAPE